jgi:hypothetical protein
MLLWLAAAGLHPEPGGVGYGWGTCGGSGAAPDTGRTSGGQPTAPNSTGLFPLSPPKAEVDDSPLQNSMDKNKECKYHKHFSLSLIILWSRNLSCLEIQFLPQRKHNASQLQISVGLCCLGKWLQHILRIGGNPLTQNAELLIVRVGGTYSYHWALMF